MRIHGEASPGSGPGRLLAIVYQVRKGLSEELLMWIPETWPGGNRRAILP
jgi:hypothetical protein